MTMDDTESDPSDREYPALDATSPTITISDLSVQDFVRYAGASGDFNPVHYDREAAEAAGSSDVFAQGMLTAGFGAQLITDWFGLSSINRFNVRLTAKVWPGDTLRVSGSLTDTRDVQEGTAADVDFEATNQDGETVMTGSASAVLSDPSDVTD